MKIEFIRPGDVRQHVVDIPAGFRITVERDDGIAATEIEAWTAMKMLCSTIIPEEKLRAKPTKKE